MIRSSLVNCELIFRTNLKPLAKLDLKEGEEVNIEISSAVKRTYGMFKVDPKTAKEIAESEDLSYLDA
jgi:predicted DNA-binding antitoxin AbrB/MazE fold protein